MKYKNLPVVITICVVVGMVAAIGFSVLYSWEPFLALSLPLELTQMEFSSDDGATWKPVGTGDEFNRQRGDVVVRGHFNYDVMEGCTINFLLRHMQMELWVNEEFVASYGRDFHTIRPEWCTDIWMCFQLPEITTEDVVEFRMYSLHPGGAEMGAYQKVLSSITLGDPLYIYSLISKENALDQYTGLAMLIIGMMLFGISLVALWMNSPLQKIMMYTALFAVGEGLFWLADAAEIAHYVHGSIAFYSTGRFVSRMLCIYALIACMVDLTSGRAKKAAQIAAYMSGVLSIAYVVLNMTGLITFCETKHIWYAVQLLLLAVVLGSCVWEIAYMRQTVWNILRLMSLGLTYGALLYDLGTQVIGFHNDMVMSKWVCGIVAITHATALLVQLPASYSAIHRAEMLSEELHNSRIVLAMSQIRTHFIFNVLNAISSLCKSDPEMADMQLVRFSRYLRNNIDIMQEDHPVPFETALEHMHNYVELEQLRFDDKIILDENYEYVDFVIPSLVIQPLVENSIKHGLLPKEEGGIIRVSTVRHGDQVQIEIADNGIGFDTRKKIAKTSVGLSNVRFRVERMMNGRMQVESTPGSGTLVRLWLPIQKEESASTLSV